MRLSFNSKVEKANAETGSASLARALENHGNHVGDRPLVFKVSITKKKTPLGAIVHINVRANVIIWHHFPLNLLHRPGKLCRHVQLKGESAFGEVGTNLVLLEDINRRGLWLLPDSFPAVLRLRAAHK